MIFSSDNCAATLENCFIANNKQNGQYLFGASSSGGSITVSNSYIDNTKKLYNPNDNVIIYENKKVSLELHLLSTELCQIGNYFVKVDKGNKILFTELIRLQDFEESIASLTF